MGVPSTLAGRFDIEREVAVGGMGRVFRGFDRQRGEPVAIKILDKHDPRTRARFMREASVLAELEHPGIVRYVAHGQTDDGQLYLAMEWLSGVDLSQFLSQRVRDRRTANLQSVHQSLDYDVVTLEPASTGTQTTRDGIRTPSKPGEDQVIAPLDLAESVFLGRRLALPLSVLHRRGIVHRDVKPGNVLVVDGKLGRLKLLDLGAAWRFDELGRLTRTGHFLGTPLYMAPEQVQNDGEIGAATDVWAMGVLLYQCITGVAPFTGRGLPALLASIVLADPRPVSELCAGMPVSLADLIMQMLAKRPADRPQSAEEVGARLDAIAEALTEDGAGRVAAVGLASTLPMGVDAPTRPASLTTLESPLTCMLFMLPLGQEGASERPDDDVTDDFADGAAVRASVAPWHAVALAEVTERLGGHSHQLFDGTAVVTVRGHHSPIEHAALAARMAIALNCAIRDASLVLVTGRRESERPVQVVASEAIAIGRETRPGTIRVDAMTASLLETRFHLVRDGDALYLGDERAFPAARMILGKPSKWLGRRRALATLTATFEESLDSESARAVLVTGASGMGKSRLCREFLGAIGRLDEPYQLLYGCGDMARGNAPFNIVTQALRRYLGWLAAEPHDTAQAKIRARLVQTMGPEQSDLVGVFLGELLGVGFSADTHPALASARTDRAFRAESMKRAWLEFLQAEAARAPILLIVEDLHWGDQPSVDYIDSALGALRDVPFMLLALARPEVNERFPRLWHRRDLTTLPLHPLSAKESRRLVENALGAECRDDVVLKITERASGNPFILEELVRVVASGSSELPATVLAVGQDRLAALDPAAKRVLRAASIFGEVFWADGVQALIQTDEFEELEAWLRVLEQDSFILRESPSRFPGRAQYRFEHALIRDAAYALLTDEDREAGHAGAAAWFEGISANEPLVLAEHFAAGGQLARAVSHYCQAAEDALAANDLRAAAECAEEAEQAGAAGVLLGRVALVQSSVAGWSSDYQASRERGIMAANLVAPGSAAWFTAVGNAIAASYRLGAPEAGQEITELAMSIACEAGAEAYQVICLCRAGFQEFFDGRLHQGQRILDQISVIYESCPNLDIRTTGQIHSILSVRSRMVGDMQTSLQHIEAAIEVFERAGDIHNSLTERVVLAHLTNSTGRYERAARYARAVFVESGRLGLVHVRRQSRSALGYALGQLGQADEAVALLTVVADEYRQVGNRRMAGGALIFLAEMLFYQGRTVEAEMLAKEAVEKTQGSLLFLSWALSVYALCALVHGRVDEALEFASRGEAARASAGGDRGRASFHNYALGRVLEASGRSAEARAQGELALVYLRENLDLIADPGEQAAFLSSPYNQRLLEWAGELGLAIVELTAKQSFKQPGEPASSDPSGTR